MAGGDACVLRGLERLRGFPEIDQRDLIRFFTLGLADEAFIASHRLPANRLGLAVQLCTLPWLGFVPDDLTAVPAAAVARLSERLGVAVGELRHYAARAQTRTDHLREVAQYLSWRPAGSLELKELDEFLLARALEHDSPTLLFRVACEFLISGCVIRPGVVPLSRRVASAREAASRETYQRVVDLLTSARREELDELLVADDQLGSTRLHWLGRGANPGVTGGSEGGAGEAGVPLDVDGCFPASADRGGASGLTQRGEMGRTWASAPRCSGAASTRSFRSDVSATHRGDPEEVVP